MSIASQLIANGIIAGSIYALIASGFALVYKVLRFLHFAHGAVFMVGGFAAYSFLVLLNLNFIVAFILAVIVTALVGVGIDFAVYKPLRKRKADELALLLASIGVFIFLQSLVLMIFGAAPKALSRGEAKEGIMLLGAFITPTQIGILVVSIVLLLGMYLFMHKTRLGKAMRAVASDTEVSSVVGIRVEKIYLATFVVGSALAGVAGILAGLEQNVEPNMGLVAILKGITAAIVGGITSVHGAMIGGFFIGLAENIGIWFLPSAWKDAIAFAILVIFLIVRPQGLFGVKRTVRSQ